MARGTSGPLTGLVKSLDAEIAKHTSLKSFVVILTDDPDKTAAALKALAAEHHVTHVPLTVVADSKGPPDYEIARDAEVTVMMWTRQKVEVNHAFKKGELTDAAAKRVIADLPKILGKPE